VSRHTDVRTFSTLLVVHSAKYYTLMFMLIKVINNEYAYRSQCAQCTCQRWPPRSSAVPAVTTLCISAAVVTTTTVTRSISTSATDVRVQQRKE
jgi:hypothetical protein